MSLYFMPFKVYVFIFKEHPNDPLSIKTFYFLIYLYIYIEWRRCLKHHAISAAEHTE